MSEAPRITMGELLEQQGEDMRMRLIAGEKGLYRMIDHPRIEKPSLAFAGFLENLSDYRLQVIGQTELHYLATRPPEEQKRVIDNLFSLRLAGVVITRGQMPPDIILEAARRTDTPLLISEHKSQKFMTDTMLYLSHKLAPKAYQHGVYLDIFGMGIMLMGPSGIGKSEVGLELISRGHRLIADDMIELVREAPGVLVGRSPESLRYHMEIRGLGIINIRDLYGAAAVADTKRVRLVVEMIPWENYQGSNRAQPDQDFIELHEVKVTRVRIPIQPGRSLAVLIEVAARNHLLRERGIDSNEAFIRSLNVRIQQQNPPHDD